MSDARFEDAGESPLRLKAQRPEDLVVISTMVQDAVAQTSEMSWLPKKRRFAVLLNRFRWEDAEAARAQKRAFERVQAVLVIDDVTRVAASGIDPADKDLVLSLLELNFVAGADGTGALTLIFSGEGEIVVSVEALDVTLSDGSRPYQARSAAMPEHGT